MIRCGYASCPDFFFKNRSLLYTHPCTQVRVLCIVCITNPNILFGIHPFLFTHHTQMHMLYHPCPSLACALFFVLFFKNRPIAWLSMHYEPKHFFWHTPLPCRKCVPTANSLKTDSLTKNNPKTNEWKNQISTKEICRRFIFLRDFLVPKTQNIRPKFRPLKFCDIISSKKKTKPGAFGCLARGFPSRVVCAQSCRRGFKASQDEYKRPRFQLQMKLKKQQYL